MASIKITAILPKKAALIDQRKLNSELDKSLDKTGNVIRGDFEKTTRTWSQRNKPSFGKIGPKNFKGGRGIEVNTNSRIYFFLTRGTRDHFVGPKRASALRFQSGYKAKTARRFIGSGSGGPFGSVVFSQGHRVSGIRARDFDKVIGAKAQGPFARGVRAAFFRASKS